jgi:hypothetical protein
VLEVLGQVPGHVGPVADDAVGGLGPDHGDLDAVGQAGGAQVVDGSGQALVDVLGVSLMVFVWDLRVLCQTATGALMPGWGS